MNDLMGPENFVGFSTAISKYYFYAKKNLPNIRIDSTDTLCDLCVPCRAHYIRI